MKIYSGIPAFLILILACFTEPAYPQDLSNADTAYISLYESGRYDDALKAVRERLVSYYNNKAEYRIPTDFIFIKKEEDRNKINDLFRKRKAHPSLAEDNPEMFSLHLYAARCCFKTGEEDSALNNYFAALQFKKPEPKDDYIYYEMSQVFKSLNLLYAYHATLETAYSFNPSKFEYSLELGKALSGTDKKKAIYHLERYIQSRGDDADAGLLLVIGNLYEDIGKYLETEKYYRKYLEKKSDDGYANFALGYIAYNRTGNHRLALECFEKSLKKLPENDIYRTAKSSEYIAEIYMRDLEYEKAVKYFNDAKTYHDKLKKAIEENKFKITETENKIRDVKAAMKTKQLYERYTEYQYLREEKGKLEQTNKELNYAFSKINAGKIRWNLAESFERLEKPEDAITNYGEAVTFDYNSNKAREKIKKLKLKINRGY